MVIQDLANYEKVFKEMYRLLLNNGSFIFSILHPCFITPVSGWEKKDDGEKLHWNVDQYFYEGAYEQRMGGQEKNPIIPPNPNQLRECLPQSGFYIRRIS